MSLLLMLFSTSIYFYFSMCDSNIIETLIEIKENTFKIGKDHEVK